MITFAEGIDEVSMTSRVLIERSVLIEDVEFIREEGLAKTLFLLNGTLTNPTIVFVNCIFSQRNANSVVELPFPFQQVLAGHIHATGLEALRLIGCSFQNSIVQAKRWQKNNVRT